MIITLSVLVQIGSNERYWRWISDYIWICYTFFIHSKITLFEGQNLGRICPLLIELLDQFPIGQIDLFLFLNTIERLAKSRVSKDIWNFLRNRHLCKILLKVPENKKNAITQKFYKKITDNFFPNFSQNVIFFHFFLYLI